MQLHGSYPPEFMSRPLSVILIEQKGLQMDLAGAVLPEHYKASDLNESVPGVSPVDRIFLEMRAMEGAPYISLPIRPADS